MEKKGHLKKYTNTASGDDNGVAVIRKLKTKHVSVLHDTCQET